MVSTESYGLFGALFGLIYLVSALGNTVQLATARDVAHLQARGGVPAWLLAVYLVELGGIQGEDGAVTGPGWVAGLASRSDSGGGLRIARVTVTIEGPAAGETMAALRLKAQRGGG